MDTRQSGRTARKRAFTLIELLTVIAIIAVLAAILFPIFGTVREQARQSHTISNLHSLYIAVRQYQEDEGRFPPVLLGYAEIPDSSVIPPNRIAKDGDLTKITPLDKITNKHPGTFLSAYLYREHLKDSSAFFNDDNLVKDKKAVTKVYYPMSVTGGKWIPAIWQATDNITDPKCPTYGDPDLPPDPSYVGKNKLFYTMDSLDIGPMLDKDGYQAKDPMDNTLPAYELHYSPDWTRLLGATCDVDGAKKPILTQLKYKNPPADRTVITYVTQHVTTAGSSKVIILLLSGTAKKVDYGMANNANLGPQLPLTFK